MLRRMSGKVAGPSLLFCLATVIASSGQTFTTLADFNYANGAGPVAAMIQGFDGNLYGTTLSGGTAQLGTLFKISPGGQLSTLYNFCSQAACTDGVFPYSAVVQDQSGNFWGTTKGSPPYGLGTVFKITPAGTLTTMHSFDGTDGSQVETGLTLGSDGNFYGVTSYSGANNGGTVFSITPAGTFTTLHDFNFSDGNNPVSALVQATDGDFYGTTLFSGANGGGTVFKMTAAGSLTTLYNFCLQPNCADGEFAYGTLIQASDGNLYGTTAGGGTISGCGGGSCGTIFKLTLSGALTTLHNFCTESKCLDGGEPLAGLVQGAGGEFYGVAVYGGANGDGTLFRISSVGKFIVLHTFDAADGAAPRGTLMQDTNGTFYGTTYTSGPGGYGTIFSRSAGVRPFVKTNPSSGPVGAAIIILGTNLTGAASVSFNSTVATFSVVSDSEIEATVPAGATSGTVKVVTAAATLKSNTRFRVTK
jgi:uncharacterized repeat protein (TIGR03803 family)